MFYIETFMNQTVDQLKVKELLGTINLREVDYLVADKILKEIVFYDDTNTASINGGLAMSEFETPVHEKNILRDDMGRLRLTQGYGRRWFTNNLCYYSSELNQAWKIKEKLSEYRISILELAKDKFECSFTHIESGLIVSEQAGNLPLAICFSALKVIELQ
jgi:hypothetical protein